jgi:nucleotide-binding universal stress UspA family protein
MSLAEPGRLDQGEQGVQRAERLGRQVVAGQPGTAATLGHHDAFCPQVTQRRPDGVPAHAVLRHQRELTGELLVEGARVEPPPQVRAELRPQRQRAAPVQPPRGMGG